MSKIKGDINREMLGYAEKHTGDCYGDGTVYRGERSADSSTPTLNTVEMWQEAYQSLDAKLGELEALKKRLAREDALDRMAENARELGLDYEPARQEQEPVAWLYRDYYNNLKLSQIAPPPPLAFPVYTAPQPEREWRGLTEEDLSVCDEDGVMLARYWESKLREKNT